MILNSDDDKVTATRKAKDVIHNMLLDSDYWSEFSDSNVDKMTAKEVKDVDNAVAKLTDRLIRMLTEESQSRSESKNIVASKEITNDFHYIVEYNGNQIGNGYLSINQAVSIKTHYENVLYCDNIVIKDIFTL